MDGTLKTVQRTDQLAGFSGKLHNFPLLDIIQMACVARRDGRLRIRRQHHTGEIVLRSGQIIHAATKLKRGEAALLDVLCWTKGNFEFVPVTPDRSCPVTIFGGWEKVLMDAVRQRDEREYENAKGRSGGQPLGRDFGKTEAAELLHRIAKENRQERRTQTIRKAVFLGLTSLLVAAVLSLFIDKDLRNVAGRVLTDQSVLQRFGSRVAWQKRTPRQILIPAGQFLFQENQLTSLSAFNIDSTEVTIWQYAQFLKAVGDSTKYDHPNQRLGKGHSNPSWQAYATAAFSDGEFKGVRINPNFPAVYLDWFDAYAFAKWENRRLPSEAEWEKAGRGIDGRRYPWGDKFVAGAANLYSEDEKLANLSEVGQYQKDCSPYGVCDLAGNVSEWTASDDGSGSPIVRGGNFMTEDGQLTRRVIGISPYTIDERIGFRTVGDNADQRVESAPPQKH